MILVFLGETKLVTHKSGTIPEIGIGTGKELIIQPLLISEKSEDVMDYLSSLHNLFSQITVNGEERKPNIYQGVVATGDQFISSNSRKKEIIELGGDIVEMEGAAIFEVTAIFDVPLIMIRAVSDKACEEAKFDFPAFICEASKNNALVITNLIKSQQLKEYLDNA